MLYSHFKDIITKQPIITEKSEKQIQTVESSSPLRNSKYNYSLENGVLERKLDQWELDILFLKQKIHQLQR